MKKWLIHLFNKLSILWFCTFLSCELNSTTRKIIKINLFACYYLKSEERKTERSSRDIKLVARHKRNTFESRPPDPNTHNTHVHAWHCHFQHKSFDFKKRREKRRQKITQNKNECFVCARNWCQCETCVRKWHAYQINNQFSNTCNMRRVVTTTI